MEHRLRRLLLLRRAGEHAIELATQDLDDQPVGRIELLRESGPLPGELPVRDREPTVYFVPPALGLVGLAQPGPGEGQEGIVHALARPLRVELV
jgi:hypothetical protein